MKEEVHLPIGPLKICSVLEPISRCEPGTHQPISRSHCATEINPVTPCRFEIQSVDSGISSTRSKLYRIGLEHWEF